MSICYPQTVFHPKLSCTIYFVEIWIMTRLKKKIFITATHGNFEHFGLGLIRRVFHMYLQIPAKQHRIIVADIWTHDVDSFFCWLLPQYSYPLKSWASFLYKQSQSSSYSHRCSCYPSTLCIIRWYPMHVSIIYGDEKRARGDLEHPEPVCTHNI